MESLKNKILKDGEILPGGILKVDSFINSQIDISLMQEIGKEFYNRFKDLNVTKILTIEASGIAIAAIAAQYFKVPMVFAKKYTSINMDTNNYEAKIFSYTKQKDYIVKVSKRFLQKEDRVLILDDFLANGYAAKGLIDLVESSGAIPVGVGIVIEKTFQEGYKLVTDRNIRLESLAKVLRFENDTVILE